MIEKVNNEDIPTSMQQPKDTSLSEASKHVRKEIDDWIKEGNEKVIISPVSSNLSEKMKNIIIILLLIINAIIWSNL